MKNTFYYLLVVLMMFSCQKVLDLETENKTSKLVVNSLFNTENSWKVDVSKSLSVLDNAELSKIDNATVSIYDGNSLVANLMYDNVNEYYSITGLSTPPVVGRTYRIEVSAPNYVSVKSENFCPAPVPITRLDTSTVSNTFGQEKMVSFTFDDPANTTNFYAIELEVGLYSRRFNSSSGNWDTTEVASEIAYLSSSNPVVDNGGPDNSSIGLTFKDALFQGQQKTISFSYFEFVSGGGPNEFVLQKFRFSSLSEEAYNYKKSINAYRNASGNPFAEPVQVFTNIENGFGIFAGESVTEIKY